MKFRPSRTLFAAALTQVAVVSGSYAAGILSPNDFVIAIDNNRNQVENTNTGGEGPGSAFDGSDTSKWFSAGKSWAGLIVTPSGGSSIVKNLSFTTGNDSPERDPIAYRLFGTNSGITSVNNDTGLAEAWTLIGGGSTGFGLATDTAFGRNTTGPLLSLSSNVTAYTSYKVVFTQLRKAGQNPFDPVTLANAANPNGIQLSEVRMFDQNSQSLFATAPINVVAINQTDSFTPPTERAIEAIDGSKGAASKYLNFGREGAGLIITPAVGSSTIRGFQLTTANDTVARDPSLYEIYGTNSSILSLEDSEGNAEAWSLITNGALTLPDARNTEGGIIGFANETAYTSYKIVFPAVKTASGANSVQFSELEFFNVPEPASASMLALAGSLLLARRRREG